MANKALKGPSFAEQLAVRIAPYMDKAVKDASDNGFKLFDSYLEYLETQMDKMLKAATDSNKEAIKDYIDSLPKQSQKGESTPMSKSDGGSSAADIRNSPVGVENTILNSVIRPNADITRPIAAGKTSVLQVTAETENMLIDFINYYHDESIKAANEVEKAKHKADASERKNSKNQNSILARLRRNTEKLLKIEKDVNTPFWLKFARFLGSGFLAGWFLDTFGDVIKGFVEGVIDSLNLRQVLDNLKEFAKEKFPTAYNIAKVVKDKLTTWYDKIISFVHPVYEWINEHTAELLAATKKIFTSAELIARTGMSKDEKTDYWYDKLKAAGADKASVGNSNIYNKIAAQVQEDAGYFDWADRNAFMKAQNRLLKEQDKAGTWSKVGHVNDYSILEEEGMVMRVSPEDYKKWQSKPNYGRPLEDVYGEYVDSSGKTQQVPVLEAPGGRYIVTNNVTKIVYANKGRELTH